MNSSSLITTLVLCLGSGEPDSPVALHQHWIESRLGTARANDGQRPISAQSQVFDPDTSDIDYDDPKSILYYVVCASSPVGVVYPTERYFYFKFCHGHRRVAGNLRFTDIEDGIVHVGYYDEQRTGEWWANTWKDGDDGVRIAFDAQSSIARVSIDGAQCDFIIDRSTIDQAPSIELEDGELFVSPVLDESGFALDLLFYEPEERFLFVLRDEMPVPERLHRVRLCQEMELYVGEESRFVFYVDPATARFVLVGVNAEAIRENSYFDGPFDQVPPRLNIRQLLLRAYPYLRWRGIDEHGNLLGVTSQRVAISPYQQYESLVELVQSLESLERPFLDGVERWSMMTYESKEDFHIHAGLTGQAIPKTHEPDISVTWPANHWGQQSQRWPPNHAQNVSLDMDAR